MTNLEYFRIFATEFSDVEDSVVESYFAIADMLLDSGPYSEEEWALIQALYAAHLMAYNKISEENSTGGIIVSEREGDLSRSYRTLTKDPSWITSTTYGAQYNAISNSIVGPAILTRMG